MERILTRLSTLAIAGGLSYSVVAHLRWDLRQVFRMAVSEGYLLRNPAELLFIPREAKRPQVTSMTFDQVRLFFSVLDVREKVIGGLAIIAGMRPGEILALRRSGLESNHAAITQRIYRGQLDTPKTFNSVRWAALGDGISGWIQQWLDMLPDSKPDAWVFPSEKGTTPVLKRQPVAEALQTATRTGGARVDQLSGNEADALVPHVGA